MASSNYSLENYSLDCGKGEEHNSPSTSNRIPSSSWLSQNLAVPEYPPAFLPVDKITDFDRGKDIDPSALLVFPTLDPWSVYNTKVRSPFLCGHGFTKSIYELPDESYRGAIGNEQDYPARDVQSGKNVQIVAECSLVNGEQEVFRGTSKQSMAQKPALFCVAAYVRDPIRGQMRFASTNDRNTQS